MVGGIDVGVLVRVPATVAVWLEVGVAVIDVQSVVSASSMSSIHQPSAAIEVSVRFSHLKVMS